MGAMAADSSSAQEFSNTVREYCKFIEEDDTTQSRDYALRCLQLLLTLHSQGLRLPELKAGRSEDGIGMEQWKAIRDRIASKLDRDCYSMIFEPFDEFPVPILASLSDDLGDIWKDLKEGLVQFDLGTKPGTENAVWMWRFGLEYHWGTHHSAHAIGALHDLLFGVHAIGADKVPI
jgi:hypothetical protein